MQELRDCRQGEGQTENRVSPRQRQKHQVCQLHVQAKTKDTSPCEQEASLRWDAQATLQSRPQRVEVTFHPACNEDERLAPSSPAPPTALPLQTRATWHSNHFCLCLGVLRCFQRPGRCFFCFSTALEVIQGISDKQMNKRMIV